MTYDFTFVVDADPHADDFEDKFIEAGCDDATFILLRGAAAISFDREAATFKDAVFSAYQQIRSSGANILRFEPDFLVSAKDIADRTGLTKAAISLYISGERKAKSPSHVPFPSPHVRFSSSHPLWDWVEVSRWLVNHEKLSASAYQEALVSRIINVGSQFNQVSKDAKFDIEAALEAI